MKERTYIAIDLKSFYASVECAERGLDPMTTNLVVADKSRTEKTICLAVSPSLKAYGISGRARLFEVVQKVKEANRLRLGDAPGGQFCGSATDDRKLRTDPSLSIDYLVVPPRMAHYMEWSTRIYEIYLGFVAPEDIHVYSIDEVFLDVTDYRKIAVPVLKPEKDTELVYVDFSFDKLKLGGSSFAQVLNKVGQEVPDVKDGGYFVKAFGAVQRWWKRGWCWQGMISPREVW